MAEIFVSYAREDEEWARRLAEGLEARGWSVFWDRHIPSGRRFAEVIREQIESANCVVVLWSAASIVSDWVLDEAAEARQQKKLLPALIERVQPPIGFRQVHAVNLTGWEGDGSHAGFERLVKDIARYVTGSTASAPTRQFLVARERNSSPGSMGRWRWGYWAIALLCIVAAWWFVSKRFVLPGQDQKNSVNGNPATSNVNASGGQQNGAGTMKDLRGATAAVASAPSAPKAGEVRSNTRDDQKYVWIPPGQFRMGCSPTGDYYCTNYDDEKPAHAVRITSGIWMGQTEVTQAAYKKLIGKNPSYAEAEDRPVEGVTWFDAQHYCKLVGGRLPTEAEWEYAARAGSTGQFYGMVDGIAWHAGNSGDQTHGAGEKKPNRWDLYDTLGNVWEWVWDWYDEEYYKSLPSPAIDPRGPAKGTERGVRGGAFDYAQGDNRLPHRRGLGPRRHFSNVGFRCAIDAFR
jgi:formylglycine-generating enzyme required for sulfatase activity